MRQMESMRKLIYFEIDLSFPLPGKRNQVQRSSTWMWKGELLSNATTLGWYGHRILPSGPELCPGQYANCSVVPPSLTKLLAAIPSVLSPLSDPFLIKEI